MSAIACLQQLTSGLLVIRPKASIGDGADALKSLCRRIRDSFETVDERGVRPASAQEITSRAAGNYRLTRLCGHTHTPRSVRLDDGRLIVNPGSVGMPAHQ